MDAVNIEVRTKSLVVANVEEFATDYMYDEKRDSLIVNVAEEYRKELYRILFDMGYEMILSHYHVETDCVTMAFIR